VSKVLFLYTVTEEVWPSCQWSAIHYIVRELLPQSTITGQHQQHRISIIDPASVIRRIHGMNWMDFVMEIQCAFCEKGTKFLNISYLSISSVGISMGGRGLIPSRGKIFLFTIMSRPALRLTKPPTQSVPGCFPPPQGKTGVTWSWPLTSI
jgi:hypothetical protein